MKRPIVLVSGDFVKTGGMDRANHALADYLTRRGDEVHVVAFRVEPDLRDRPNLIRHVPRKPLGSYTLGLPFLSRLGLRTAAELAPRGARVVVNGGNCPWADLNWVHHLNVLDVPRGGGSMIRRLKARHDFRTFAAAERRALGAARRLVTTCRRNREDLVRVFGLSGDRIEVVPYGVDASVFHPPGPGERVAIRDRLGWDRDRATFLFVGALGVDRRKGFDTLFEAWAQLCRTPDWAADLAVAGDGPDRAHWEARASEQGLGARIRFLGFRRDVPDLFRACDGHVLPSRYEGYSLVTQEAICSGLPAFVARTAGIADEFGGDLAEALLIDDPDDPAALAARLARWSDRARAVGPSLEALSARLRARSWDRMAAEIAAILDQDDRRGGTTPP